MVLRSLAHGRHGPVLQAPHLRLGVIPAPTYAGLDQPVTTVTQQAVVLGPATDPNRLGV